MMTMRAPFDDVDIFPCVYGERGEHVLCRSRMEGGFPSNVANGTREHYAFSFALEHPDTPSEVIGALHEWLLAEAEKKSLLHDWFGTKLGMALAHPNLPPELFRPSMRTKFLRRYKAFIHLGLAQNPNLPAEEVERMLSMFTKMQMGGNYASEVRIINTLLTSPAADERTVARYVSRVHGTDNWDYYAGQYEYPLYANLSDEVKEDIFEGRNMQVGTAHTRLYQLASNRWLSDEHLARLIRMDDPNVLSRLAQNPIVPPSVLSSMARYSTDVTRYSDIQEGALSNPSTPVATMEAQYRRLIKRGDVRYASLYRAIIARHPNVSSEIAEAEFSQSKDMGILYARTLPQSAWEQVYSVLPVSV